MESTRQQSSSTTRHYSFLVRCLGKHEGADEIHYEITELDEFCFPRLRLEWRDDTVCPFCAFQAASRSKLWKHLPRFHGDHHAFQITHQNNITNVVARPTRAYRDQSKLEVGREMPQEPQLEDFQFVRCRNSKRRRIRVDPTVAPEIGSAATLDEPDDEELPQRQFYHSRSRVPIRVGDWDVDSDEESDNEWIDQWAQGGLREYLDVKDHEKRVLDLWNRHMRSDAYVPDKVFFERVKDFMRCHCGELPRQQMIMLLVVFTEHRLISPTQLKECMEYYDETIQGHLR